MTDGLEAARHAAEHGTPPPAMIPYGRTGSGHAGNATSRERQERNDATGITSATQVAVLNALDVAKSEGITCGEVEDGLNLHHGAASSALSHLHRAGHITRIKMRRKRHEIYVLPEFVNGREESPYRPRQQRPHPSELSDEVVAEAMMKGAEATGVSLGGPQALDLVKAILKELP